MEPEEDGDVSLWSVVFDPTLLAVLFAVMSLPVVAVTMPVWAHGREVSAADPARWAAAAGAVLMPAVIMGTIGAPIVRWHGVIGGWLVLTLAWILTIVVLLVLGVAYWTRIVRTFPGLALSDDPFGVPPSGL